MTDQPVGAERPDPDGLFDFLPTGGDKPSLGEIETVDGIVRAFALRLIEFRRAYLTTGKPLGSPEAFIEKEAAAMARVFLGEDDDYEGQPWNSPEQLGVALGQQAGIEGEPREVVEAFFVKLAADLMDLAVEHEKGVASDPKFQLDVMIEEAVYALLGLPLSAA